MPQDSSAQPVDARVMSDLYRIMLRIRQAELKITEIYPSDKIQSPVHLSIGQEAVSAGVCLALGPEDRIYGTYRGHGIYIAKGGDLRKLFAELYGKDTGCARGKGGSMHLVAPEIRLMGCSAIVASTIPLAAGDALAAQMQNKKRVTVAFFGDGAVDEGVFFETLNFAALKNLPMIFVCENNHYAVHSRVGDRHKNTKLFQYGETLGIAGSRHDGNDAEAVYTTMRDAIQKIKMGGAPVLLEYQTYRIYEHVGPGKDHGEPYREKDHLGHALCHDPIEKARQLLLSRYGIPEKDIHCLGEDILREVQSAVDYAQQSPFPAPDELLTGLFKESR